MALRIAQKSLNDTMVPEGLFCTLLVYCMIPRLLVVQLDFPNQQARMPALEVSMGEMTTIAAKLRITQALR